MSALNLAKHAATLAVFIGVLYQLGLRDLIWNTAGVGRVVQPIEDFQEYTCRRIRHSKLEGCEDMWLDDKERLLYAACASSTGRVNWCPSVDRLNAAGRGPTNYISVLNVDEPGTDGLFGLRQLKPTGFESASATGDGSMELHGFDAEVINDSTLRFWLINHRPPVSEVGMLLDAKKLGANSTVEIFDVSRGRSGDKMAFVKTVAGAEIYTPNKPASTGDGGFLITNDKSAKVGLRRQLDLVLGGGTVAYCDPSSTCHIAAPSGFNYPNGIVKGSSELYYVPSSAIDMIRVMRLQEDLTLKQVDVVHTGMPIDNLSVDKNGDIYAAGFPKALQFIKSTSAPHEIDAPTTIWRIRRVGDKHEVKKILEDKEAKILGGATVAVHDVKTGRIFVGGAFSPYIGVCDRR